MRDLSHPKIVTFSQNSDISQNSDTFFGLTKMWGISGHSIQFLSYGTGNFTNGSTLQIFEFTISQHSIRTHGMVICRMLWTGTEKTQFI